MKPIEKEENTIYGIHDETSIDGEKVNRNERAESEELSFFASTSSIQTCGSKRIGDELNGNESKKIKIKEGANKGKHSLEQKIKFESSESTDSESDDEGEDGKIQGEKDPPAAKPPSTPAVYVTVNRKSEIQAAREALPIYCKEEAIIKAIKAYPVVLIHGETGSGKTTQVPQILYKAGFTQNNRIIGVTVSKKRAAISIAARVGGELNAPEKVSYHTSYGNNVCKKTKIKYMADSVLLKEMHDDFTIAKYSVIIVDDADKRSVITDVLIGLLSKIILIRAKQNDPLKVIIMSATIQVEIFMKNLQLLNDQFLIQIDSQQPRVQIHFLNQTPDDYIDAAFQMVCDIHCKHPTGAIMLFLTGKKEIQRMVKMLRDAFPLKINEEKENEGASPLYVLPLYSVLPSHHKKKIIQPPLEGSRLVLIATNVAETSLKIPEIKYIVDTGKVKTKVNNSVNQGISKMEVVWCCKASANQRARRCERSEGGHCYRLYSSADYEEFFPEFSLPEIQRTPLDDILLQLKALHINNVLEFPFPSPPEKEALEAAEKRLICLGALDQVLRSSEQEVNDSKVTIEGSAMSKLPVRAHLAKMCLLSVKKNCIQQVVAIVSALTVLQLSATHTEDENEDTKISLEGMKKMGTRHGKHFKQFEDILILLRAVIYFGKSNNRLKFCKKYGLMYRSMTEVRTMYTQIVKQLNQLFPETRIPVAMKMNSPDEEKVQVIMKIMAACLVDRVAKKFSKEEIKDEKSLKFAYQCIGCDDPVYIHPSSSQFERVPNFVVYNEIIVTSKKYMRGVVEIDPKWLPQMAPNSCSFTVFKDPEPYFHQIDDKILCAMGVTFGRWKWKMPSIHGEMPTGYLKYSWFCFFLLDGKIINYLKKFRGSLLAEPSIIFESGSKLLTRVYPIVQATMSQEVASRSSLMKEWKKNPKFLLKEYLFWIPTEQHTEVELKWPPKFNL